MITNPIKNPYEAYVRLIEMYDNSVMTPLAELSKCVRCEVEQKFWTKKINEALDERIRMMATRDSYKELLENDL